MVTHEYNIAEALGDLQSQLYDISTKNPFLHLNIDRLYFPDDTCDQTAVLEKIHQKQQHYLRAYGLDTTLSVGFTLQWVDPKNEKSYCSPVLYKPCLVHKIRRIAVEYDCEVKPVPWQV